MIIVSKIIFFGGSGGGGEAGNLGFSEDEREDARTT